MSCQILVEVNWSRPSSVGSQSSGSSRSPSVSPRFHVRGRGRYFDGNKVKTDRFSMFGTDDEQESSAHRDERRDCRSASKSSHDRRTRDVHERQVRIEPERTSAREPSSSNAMRPHSVESAASERESHATDSHSRESSVRASPRGLYVWGDDVVDSDKGGRTESIRGSTCPREKSFSRSPRASTSLPKPRESLRREERCSAAPSDRRSTRESRSPSRGTEVTEGRRSASRRTSGSEDAVRGSKSYRDDTLECVPRNDEGTSRVSAVPSRPSHASSSRTVPRPSTRGDMDVGVPSQEERVSAQRVSWSDGRSHSGRTLTACEDDTRLSAVAERTRLSALREDRLRGSVRGSVADNRRTTSTRTPDFAQAASGDDTQSQTSHPSHVSQSGERQSVRRKSSTEHIHDGYADDHDRGSDRGSSTDQCRESSSFTPSFQGQIDDCAPRSSVCSKEYQGRASSRSQDVNVPCAPRSSTCSKEYQGRTSSRSQDVNVPCAPRSSTCSKEYQGRTSSRSQDVNVPCAPRSSTCSKEYQGRTSSRSQDVNVPCAPRSSACSKEYQGHTSSRSQDVNIPCALRSAAGSKEYPSRASCRSQVENDSAPRTSACSKEHKERASCRSTGMHSVSTEDGVHRGDTARPSHQSQSGSARLSSQTHPPPRSSQISARQF